MKFALSLCARSDGDHIVRHHPNWAQAIAVLAQVLPGATGFIPDRSPGLAANRWKRFKIDDRDPDDVTAAFLGYCLARVTGPLIVVTDGSFSTGAGPFLVEGEHLAEFATTYSEPFVAGDTIVVSQDGASHRRSARRLDRHGPRRPEGLFAAGVARRTANAATKSAHVTTHSRRAPKMIGMCP
ncbi:hypothetical protein ACFY4C_35415 [Actinomadura viridis]|uniref:hypothetical protein n=1 Tax=Actinomadura viridis TaxID=58110 RepID=UPI00368973B1